MRIHADDFGISKQQAKDILHLSSSCGGSGALNSVSIFANSPCFQESSELLKLPVQENKIALSLHINLVEGPSCAPAQAIPLLVNTQGVFKNDFATLLLLSCSPYRKKLYQNIVKECTAQLTRYLEAFPEQRKMLSVDTHQHVHAIPLVLDALLASVSTCHANLTHMRIPIEDLSVYKAAGLLANVSWQNKLKIKVIKTLCKKAEAKLPQHCAIPVFCGVGLSGQMHNINKPLLNELNLRAKKQKKDIEVLFHPVSVPLSECLDPNNKPFASVCASPERDKEAQTIQDLEYW